MLIQLSCKLGPPAFQNIKCNHKLHHPPPLTKMELYQSNFPLQSQQLHLHSNHDSSYYLPQVSNRRRCMQDCQHSPSVVKKPNIVFFIKNLHQWTLKNTHLLQASLSVWMHCALWTPVSPVSSYFLHQMLETSPWWRMTTLFRYSLSTKWWIIYSVYIHTAKIS